MAATLAAIALASCDAPMGDFQDPAADLTRSDFENMLGSSNFVEEAQPGAEAPPIPDLVPTLVAPVPNGAEERLVSISVTSTVPIRDVLLELARAAEVDLELDPAIEGGIIFTANNKPFIEVVDRIADLANLRYTFKNGVLRVELDRPYHRNYSVDQLAAQRTGTGEIDVTTDVFSSGGSTGAGGNGSTATITQATDSDFYLELETNIRQILANSAPTVDIGEIQLASTTVTGADGTITTTETPVGAVEDFSLHRQGGLISVYATQRQHKLVQDYLIELMAQVGSQVLIEAKILEVDLKDEFRSGIEWDAVADILGGTVTTAASVGAGLFTEATDAIVVEYDGTDVNGIMALISTFGTTRTLANPRLAINNNQPAILKVARNQVYFTIELDQETTEFGIERTFTSTLNTVPVGLIMTVQPVIDLDSDTVTLSLRPTLSRIVDFIDDPAVALASDNEVVSQVPVTEVREMDSVVTAKSGEVIIMGGLMQEVSRNDETGVPGLMEIPWVGNVFKSNDDQREVIELVIFLRAQIVRTPVPDPADIDLYSTFTLDPRPLTF